MRVYNVTIDDLTMGIDAISLVESPAVERNFLCFSKDNQPVRLQLNSEKRIITGVIALADTPIYRYSPEMGEYYVVFSKDVVRKMVEKFAKDDLFKSVNIQHDDNRFVDGIYMFESYIVDKERGISPVEFSDIPDGSWIGSYKIDDIELWNEIVNGDKLNGFSLQGLFGLIEQRMSAEQKDNEPEPFDEWLEKQING